MSRLIETWYVGQPVWASHGNTTWRPAVITKVGHKLLEVLFQDGARTYGKRSPKNLRSRDKTLKGADKPTDGLDHPLREKIREGTTEATGGALVAPEGEGRERRVMRNVRLGRGEW